MPRFISPITDIKPLGSVSFFDANTNAPKLTYKDELETIANLLTIPVDAGGNLPNIFFSGSASVIYLDQFDVQYAARNPVGEEVGVGNFTPWSTFVSYSGNDITIGSDGEFYLSITDGNQDNDPTISPVDWERIRFLGAWNTNITYSIGDVAQTPDGNLWKSVIGQSGNDPTTDIGSSWLPAVDVTNASTVIPQLGGGVLTASRINELRDGSAYALPLAIEVPVNRTITIDLPQAYGTFNPTVSRLGSDTITDGAGADTSIVFVGATKITLTSDGVSNWSL